MIKTKRQMFTIIGAFALVLLLGTVTYAFFNYTRTGIANNIRTGRIYFNTSQDGNINLTNMFPIEATSANLSDNTKVGTITIDVVGDTTYDNGVEYLVSAVNVNNIVISGSNEKELPISIDVSYGEASGETIGALDNSYFTNRGGNSSIYKVLAKDTISNDDQLIVGYIAKGATGIDGTITIKAYLDKSKIAITDTYDETSPETDYNGTTTNWVSGRTVFTTAEWNSLQTNGVSFQVKVEANEGIWVPEPLTSYTQIIRNVNTTTTINFGDISSASNGQGLYILPGTENDTNPIYYYRGAVTDNNVIFGGYCWQIVRTTETGGTKMIYNGVATDNGTTCTNTAHADRILTTSCYDYIADSISDIGYMKNEKLSVTNSYGDVDLIYGKDIEWHTDHYLVIENTANIASTNTTLDNNHHYSCETAGVTSCSSVRYYYKDSSYITLSEGDLLEDAIYKMTGNGSNGVKSRNVGYNINANDSKMKEEIDNWFKTNLTNEVDNTKTDYSVYLEDTVFCNDRSFKTTGSSDTYLLSGWNPIGGDISYPNHLYFGSANRFSNMWYSTTNVPTVKNTGEIPNIACPNETDRFSVGSSVAHLNYPVGLLTADEIIMAGASGNGVSYNNNTYYLYTGGYYWSLSPRNFTGSAVMHMVTDRGSLSGAYGNYYYGVRPVVSLKPGTEFETGGEGTTIKPYVVKYN